MSLDLNFEAFGLPDVEDDNVVREATASGELLRRKVSNKLTMFHVHARKWFMTTHPVHRLDAVLAWWREADDFPQPAHRRHQAVCRAHVLSVGRASVLTCTAAEDGAAQPHVSGAV